MGQPLVSMKSTNEMKKEIFQDNCKEKIFVINDSHLQRIKKVQRR